MGRGSRKRAWVLGLGRDTGAAWADRLQVGHLYPGAALALLYMAGVRETLPAPRGPRSCAGLGPGSTPSAATQAPSGRAERPCGQCLFLEQRHSNKRDFGGEAL